MARIVLHIGAHKTGTTYLQNLFHHNRQRLAAAGLHYPHIGPNTAHHALARPWLAMNDIPDGFFGRRGPDGLWEDLIDEYQDKEGVVFLSGENFSRCHPQSVNMVELAERLSVFEDVHILYVMRAQTEMIQSLWLQVKKSGRDVSVYNYVRTAIEKRRGLGVWIDHNAVYDALLQGFDPAQITMMDYGTFQDSQTAQAQAILDMLGIDLRAADLTQPQTDEANISPDPLGFWIASEISEPHLPSPELLAAISEPLLETGRQNTLLARHEYVKTAARYGAANEKLVTRLQDVQPGFTFQNVTPPEDMIYREEIPDMVWLRIVEAAYSVGPSQPLPGTLIAQVRRRLGRFVRGTLRW